MLYVVKRDGRKVQFNADKISKAIKGAASEGNILLKETALLNITHKVIEKIEDMKVESVTVE